MPGLAKVRIPYSALPADSVDVRELPLYSLTETAYFLGIPKSTLQHWIRRTRSKGMQEIEPLIIPADRESGMFSFYNLSEAHILSVTTRVHKLKLKRVRGAITQLRKLPLSNPLHPLLSREFYTDGRDIFVKMIEGRAKLTVNVSQHSQLGLREILDSYLERIERDEAFNPKKLYPVNQPGKVVSIVPTVSSGRPIIDSAGIPVVAIWNRHHAGDSVELIANDYEIPESQIEGALNYIGQLAA
jgi:uncharacterized protein (DUF433 family)